MGNKPIDHKNYGTIPHLSFSNLGEGDKVIEPGQEKIITQNPRGSGYHKGADRFIVTLKYDGSNVGVLKKDSELITVTRKGNKCVDSQFAQHQRFDEWIKLNRSKFDLLPEGWRVVGEWLYQAHGIKYSIRGEPFVAFDIFDENNKRIPFSEFLEYCAQMPVNVPFVIDITDKPLDKERLAELWKRRFNDLSISPIEGDHEGMVIKVETNGEFNFIAKYVDKNFTPGLYLGKGLNDNEELIENYIQQ